MRFGSSEKEADLVWAVQSKTKFADNDEKDRIISGLRWIGMFSDANITPRGNPLDTLCATLEEKMQYEKGERDMVMLQHRFEVELKDGKKVSNGDLTFMQLSYAFGHMIWRAGGSARLPRPKIVTGLYICLILQNPHSCALSLTFTPGNPNFHSGRVW